MIKTILFDADGVLLTPPQRFSQRFSEEFGIPLEKLETFFHGDFKKALSGEANLLELLEPQIPKWGWQKSAEDLLYYWFTNENYLNIELVEEIIKLKELGISCNLVSNQEQYRAAYLSEEVGLGDLLERLFFSSDLGITKPSREFWELVYSQLPNVDKKDILVWDDSLEVVASARDFGFHAELYTDIQNFQKRMQHYL